MRYIERKFIDPIISDFDDQISSFNDAPDKDVDFTITVDDFKSFDEKVRFYIHTHTNDNLINNIMNLQPYKESDILNFKDEIIKFSKSEEEYKSLFNSDKDIIYFIRRNVEINPLSIDNFINIQRLKGRTEAQLTYIEELIKYINKNGKFERKDLLKEELHFVGLFDNIQISSLLKDLEDVL